MGLENRLVDIRDALKTGRGQRIRGEISRAVRTSTLILEDLELLTLRAERLDFKARNLQLDAQYGLGSGHVQQQLLSEAQQIRNTARGYIDRYDEWMKITAERGAN